MPKIRWFCKISYNSWQDSIENEKKISFITITLSCTGGFPSSANEATCPSLITTCMSTAANQARRGRCWEQQGDLSASKGMWAAPNIRLQEHGAAVRVRRKRSRQTGAWNGSKGMTEYFAWHFVQVRQAERAPLWPSEIRQQRLQTHWAAGKEEQRDPVSALMHTA